MTVSINSQSFRDAAKKIEQLNTQGILDTEYLDKILVEEGYDPEKERDEFINQYSKYSNMSDEELDKPLEITGLNVVDPVLRVGGRAIGEAVEGVAEFSKDVAPNLTKQVSDTFSVVSDKLGAYVPDEVKEYADELFDPYHGDGIFAEGEKMTGNVLSYFIPATGIIKAGRGVTSLAKGNKTLRSALNKRPVKVVGYGTAYAGGATIIEDPSENLVNTLVKQFPESVGFLEAVAVNPDDSAAQQRLNAFLNNLGLEAVAFGGLGALGLAYKKSKGLRKTIVPNYLTQKFTTRRGLDDKHLAAFIKNDAASRNNYDLAVEEGKELKKAMRKSNFTSSKNIELVDKALQGGSLNNLPSNVKDIVLKMRGNIDSLSEFFLKNDRTSGKLNTKMDKNLNTYITRSYEIFDNPNYVTELEKSIKKNRKNIERGQIKNITNDALKSMSDYLVNDVGLRPDQAMKHIDDRMKTFKEKGELLFHYAGRSTGASTSTKAFMKQKKIPNKVKAFYGEVKDPVLNYVNTYQKLATYKAEIKFLEDLSTDMIRSGAAKRGEVIKGRWESPKNVKDLELANDILEEKLGKIFGRGVVQQGTVKNPLDGLYVDPNYNKMLQEGLDFLNPANSSVMKYWLKAKVGTQLSKTVFSPITHARNVIGNGIFMISNGFVPGTVGTKDAISFAASNLSGLKNKELVKKFNEYRELGITGTDIASETMRTNLRRLGSNPDAYKKSIYDIRGVPRKITDKIIDIYQLEDDIFKITHFENTKKYLRKAFPNKKDSELIQEAAKRTRDLMPNYKIAPRYLKDMRSWAIGDFATFAAESARVSKNLFKYTIADGLSGNGTLTQMAARRLAGLTAAGLGFDALSERSKILMGITDKQENSLETVGETWEYAVPQLYLSGIEKQAGKNVVKTVSTGAVNPFSFPYTTAKVLHRIINDPKFNAESLKNINNNPELKKMMLSLFDKTMSPFIGTSMATDALLKAATGISEGEVPEDYANTALEFLKDIGPPPIGFLAKRRQYEQEKKTKDEGERDKGGSSKALFSEYTKGVPGETDWESLLGFKVRLIDIDSTVPFTIGYDLQNINKNRKVSRMLKNKLSTYQKTKKYFTGDTYGVTVKDIKDAKISDENKKLKDLKQIRMYLKAYQNLGLDFDTIQNDLGINLANPIGVKAVQELAGAYNNSYTPQFLTDDDIQNYIKNLRPKGISIPNEFFDKVNNKLVNTKIDEDD